MLINIKLRFIVLFGFALCFSSVAFVQAQITIEERQQAELPLVLIPTARQKIILKPNGNLGGNTTASIVGGQAMSGLYTVSSDSDRSISINILSNEDEPYIKLKNFKVVYQGVTYKKFPAVGLPSPRSGEDIKVGFTVILKSSAGEGLRLPSYTLDINEE